MITKKETNSYNVFNKNNYTWVVYHVIASSPEEVIEMLEEQGFDTEYLDVELDKRNVKDEMGRSFAKKISVE